MSKLGNLWKTVLAGGAGVAALAAVNASIERNALEPDDSALGGEAKLFTWKTAKLYKEAGAKQSRTSDRSHSWYRRGRVELHVAQEHR